MSTPHICGIGLPRTGTSSLKAALKILSIQGEKIHVGDHMVLPYDRFKTLDKKYPSAKFIFTKRESAEKWLTSVKNRTKVIGGNESILRNRERMYGARSVIPEKYLPRYYMREVDVLDYFKVQYPETYKDKILVCCWECGDSWDELCSFLGLPVPNADFPHKNKSK